MGEFLRIWDNTNAKCQGLTICQLPNPLLFQEVISIALIFISAVICGYLKLVLINFRTVNLLNLVFQGDNLITECHYSTVDRIRMTWVRKV